MRRTLLLVGAYASVLTAACERTKAPARNESAVTPSAHASPPVGTIVPTNAGTPRDDQIGWVVATPSLDGGAPVSFVRDTIGNAALGVELLGRDGTVLEAMLRRGSPIGSCAWRRNASLTLADGSPVPNGWSLALASGIATPLAMNGMEGLSPRDSAATVARISRLVSAIPEDSMAAPYRGLPVVVRDAWHVTLADSTMILVAIAMRSLNVESDPRAQAIALIAQPDASAGAGQWRTVFSERVEGAEDHVEGMDVLAAFMVRGTTPSLALVREGGAGTEIEIVERVSSELWAVRWSSANIPCMNSGSDR